MLPKMFCAMPEENMATVPR